MIAVICRTRLILEGGRGTSGGYEQQGNTPVLWGHSAVTQQHTVPQPATASHVVNNTTTGTPPRPPATLTG